MPIYEYECSKCGRLEVFQRITDGSLDRCPTCQRRVKKLISQSSFHLKGSGWYVTDYARKGAPAGAASASEAGTAAASTTEATPPPSPPTSESPSPSTNRGKTKSSTKNKGKGSGCGSEAA